MPNFVRVFAIRRIAMSQFVIPADSLACLLTAVFAHALGLTRVPAPNLPIANRRISQERFAAFALSIL
ncbi:MAG: hypothetical protein D8M55_11155 [Chloroflexi bacterium]|nr:hypothetical protein [Anaerolineae bacterium]MBL1172985.1 hypothetical protein [Chloroflexota bacterium]